MKSAYVLAIFVSLLTSCRHDSSMSALDESLLNYAPSSQDLATLLHGFASDNPEPLRSVCATSKTNTFEKLRREQSSLQSLIIQNKEELTQTLGINRSPFAREFVFNTLDQATLAFVDQIPWQTDHVFYLEKVGYWNYSVLARDVVFSPLGTKSDKGPTFTQDCGSSYVSEIHYGGLMAVVYEFVPLEGMSKADFEVRVQRFIRFPDENISSDTQLKKPTLHVFKRGGGDPSSRSNLRVVQEELRNFASEAKTTSILTGGSLKPYPR